MRCAWYLHKMVIYAFHVPCVLCITNGETMNHGDTNAMRMHGNSFAIVFIGFSLVFRSLTFRAWARRREKHTLSRVALALPAKPKSTPGRLIARYILCESVNERLHLCVCKWQLTRIATRNAWCDRWRRLTGKRQIACRNFEQFWSTDNIWMNANGNLIQLCLPSSHRMDVEKREN